MIFPAIILLTVILNCFFGVVEANNYIIIPMLPAILFVLAFFILGLGVLEILRKAFAPQEPEINIEQRIDEFLKKLWQIITE